MALRVTEFLACENILGESDFSPLLSGPQAAEEGAFHCLRSYSVGWGRRGDSVFCSSSRGHVSGNVGSLSHLE